MFRDDDLTSTEKLLDVIRESDSGHTASSQSLGPRRSTPRHPSWTQRIRNFRAPVTVGIDLGAKDVKLAGIRHHSDGRKEILELKQLSLNQGVENPAGPRYRSVLPEISAFGKRHKASAVWAAYYSEAMTARHLRLPRLASSYLAKAVQASFKKEQDGRKRHEIFDFKVLGPVRGGRGGQREVIACAVDAREVERCHASFLEMGVNLTGLSVYPFAFQNLLRRLRRHADDNRLCVLHIGQAHSYICIYFRNGTLALSRIIKTSLDSLMAPVRNELVKQRQSGRYPSGSEGDTADSQSGVGDEILRIFSRLLDVEGTAESDRPIMGDWTRQTLVEMMTPALDRLGKQVAATIDHFLRNERGGPFSELLISGDEGVIPEWRRHLERQLDLPVTVLDPTDSVIEISDKALLGEADRSASAPSLRGRFAVALGMALCDRTVTPNFIFTYRDEDRKRSASQLRHLMVGGVLLLAVVAIGVVFWQEWQLSRKREYLAQLQGRLEAFTPQLSREMISETIAEIHEKRLRLRTALSDRLLPAVFGEISNNTPDSVRLIRVRISQPEKNSIVGKSSPMNIHIEGIIVGEEINVETALTTFRTNLRNAELIGQLPSIPQRSEGFLDGRKAVLFTMTLDLR